MKEALPGTASQHPDWMVQPLPQQLPAVHSVAIPVSSQWPGVSCPPWTHLPCNQSGTRPAFPLLKPHPVSVLRKPQLIEVTGRVSQSSLLVPVEEQPLPGSTEHLARVTLPDRPGRDEPHGAQSTDGPPISGEQGLQPQPFSALIPVRKDERIHVATFRTTSLHFMLCFYGSPNLSGEEFTFNGDPEHPRLASTVHSHLPDVGSSWEIPSVLSRFCSCFAPLAVCPQVSHPTFLRLFLTACIK